MCSNISESYCAMQADKAKKNTATLLIAVIVPVVAITLMLFLWMLCCKGETKQWVKSRCLRVYCREKQIESCATLQENQKNMMIMICMKRKIPCIATPEDSHIQS
jgi:hypothetical protein